MTARNVRIEIPDLKYVNLPSLTLSDGRTLPDKLLELARADEFFTYSLLLREVARILEALRIGFMSTDADDYDREQMTEGELAMTRGQQTISRQLGEIITLMKKEAAAKELDRTSP